MKTLNLVLIVVCFLFTACARQAVNNSGSDFTVPDSKAIMEEDNVTSIETAFEGKTSMRVEIGDEKIRLVFTNPLVTPTGVDTKGENLKPAKKVKLGSGILDAEGKIPYFTLKQVIGNQVEFVVPKLAKKVGEPVVELIWGYAQAVDRSCGSLVLDPNNKWVIFEGTPENPDMQTLAIGYVTYLDGIVRPLKELGKGKLEQGIHPELSKSK